MSFDIYGARLEPGHCEVHPDVAHTYPCPRCMEANRDPEYPPEPEPCEGCHYVTGWIQACDGSCDGLTISTSPKGTT